MSSDHLLAVPENASKLLASVLRRHGKIKDLCDGRRVHTCIVRCGYDNSTFIGNCIVQMYGNCGSMDDARAVFDKLLNPNTYSWNILMNAYTQNANLKGARIVFARMPRRDLISWNTMIAALSQNEHAKEALDLFHKMQVEKMTPNHISFICALDACANLAAFREGCHICDTLHGSKHGQDVAVLNAMINMYGKCRSVQDSRRVFDEMPYRDVISWTTMIAVLSQNGQGREALDLFWQMPFQGIEQNGISYVCALDACTSLASLPEGRHLHAAIISSGYGQLLEVANTLINMYGRCWMLNDAQWVFVKMPHRDIVSWNTMIAACVHNHLGEEALDLFGQMQKQGMKPDCITFVSILNACSDLAVLKEGQDMHMAIVDSGYTKDSIVDTALINMYGKCGSVHDAENVFERINHRDIVCWNSMMATFCQNELDEKALNLFHQMQLQGVKRDLITFICALDACANLAALDEGQDIHAAILESGYGQNVYVGTALMNMYGKCGCVHNAEHLFRMMTHRDVAAWTTMMAAFAQNGHVKESLDLFSEMQHEGIRPDSTTFVCILTACSYTGLVNDGRQFFLSITRDHGLMHTAEHYVCMIDLLGRAGCLDEAEGLIKNMPVQNLALAWRCLLGACVIHGDVQRAVQAANHCFVLDPENGIPHVTLSNIYSLACRPHDAILVREAMKKGGMKQKIGHSFIEPNKSSK